VGGGDQRSLGGRTADLGLHLGGAPGHRDALALALGRAVSFREPLVPQDRTGLGRLGAPAAAQQQRGARSHRPGAGGADRDGDHRQARLLLRRGAPAALADLAGGLPGGRAGAAARAGGVGRPGLRT
jgi:hypothetical protein